MNLGGNDNVVDIDQVLQNSARNDEEGEASRGDGDGGGEAKVHEEEGELGLPNESTFFTEGILNVGEAERVAAAEPKADEPDMDSNFQTAIFEEIKQRPAFISSTVQDLVRPSVNFKLERVDKAKQKAKSAPSKKLQAKRSTSSSNNRQFSDTPDKNVIYPYFENNSVQFLPSIQCEKDKFPSRRNLHHKRIFVRYITNKMEKEHELLSMLRSNTMPLNSSTMNTAKAATLNPAPGKAKKPKTGSLATHNKESSVYITTKDSDSQNYYDTRTIFAAPPPPPPSAKARAFQRSKSTLAPSSLPAQARQRPLVPSVFEMDDEIATKSVHFNYGREHSNINLVNNIVDLNVISSTSKLSGHYLSYEGKSRLADLNLNEIWPASTMYKVSIKENPWVTSFKAKSQANEINSTFRDNFDSNLSFTRLHSSAVAAAATKVKASQHALTAASQTNFFPNIKNLL